jgi:DNA-binding NarL/FixJ family response regulator
LKNGADGYVLKDVQPDELVLAIKSIAKGLNIIHKSAYEKVISKYNDAIENKVKFDENASNYEFSEKEKDIIMLITEGKANKEIAIEVGITEGSIKNIITGILKNSICRIEFKLLFLLSRLGWRREISSLSELYFVIL